MEKQQAVMQILKAGALYFDLVFGAGFVLGTIRILLIVPRLGMRTAELIEAPPMSVVTILAARWAARRLSLSPTPATRLGVGFIALGLLLIAEFGVVLWLRGLTIREYFADRDPVAGTMYFVMPGAFAIMPVLVARKEDRSIRSGSLAARRSRATWTGSIRSFARTK